MYLLAFVRLRRIGGTKSFEDPTKSRRALMLALMLGPLLFLGVANSANFIRLAYDSYFGFLLLTWYCRQRAAGRLFLAGLTLVSVTAMLGPFRYHPKDVIDIPAGRVAYRGDSGLARWLKDNTKPGDYVLEAELGTYYFLYGLRNPTPIAFLTNSGYTRPMDVSATIDGLERHHVRYILMEDGLNSSVGGMNLDYLKALRFYISKHYRVIRHFSPDMSDSDTQVWERSDPK
jgi:hypothetical protein